MSGAGIHLAKQIEAQDSAYLYGDDYLNHESRIFADAMADKGFSGAALDQLAYHAVAGTLFSRYFLGEVTRFGPLEATDMSAYVMQRIVTHSAYRIKSADPTYDGSDVDNHEIIRGSYRGRHESYLRSLRRNGAQRHFRSGLVNVEQTNSALELPEVPIAIVGAGAAGILTARAVMESGFHNVRVFDRRAEAGGIWNQHNVGDGSKNNPFALGYDHFTATAASSYDDPRGSGRDIQQYIYNIATGRDPVFQYPLPAYGRRIRVQQANVVGIEPGNLDHAVHIQRGSQTTVEHFPIVVYAPGNGRPLPLSHKEHMTTPPDMKHGDGGIRWQQQLSPEKLRALEGKRVIFIGLGNSTSEMVDQLQEHTRKTGQSIDYRIITHFPQEEIQQNNTNGAPIRPVYRNIKVPELTSLAGDLRHIDTMFTRAVDEGKVITDIKYWYVERGSVVVKNSQGVSTSIEMDEIYTLTGYGQDPKELAKMGITCLDPYYGTGSYDYDGEVHSNPGEIGRGRLHTGYYAIGPVVKTKLNPNAEVIPGIQYELNDLITGLVIRAVEYALIRRQASEASKRKSQVAY